MNKVEKGEFTMEHHTVRFKAIVSHNRRGRPLAYLPEKDEDGDDLVWLSEDEVLVTVEWQERTCQIPTGSKVKLKTS